MSFLRDHGKEHEHDMRQAARKLRRKEVSLAPAMPNRVMWFGHERPMVMSSAGRHERDDNQKCTPHACAPRRTCHGHATDMPRTCHGHASCRRRGNFLSLPPPSPPVPLFLPASLPLLTAAMVQNYKKRAQSMRNIKYRDFKRRGAEEEEQGEEEVHPDNLDPLTRPLPEDFTFA